jgi:uncharacterized protein (TIGR02246 family)
MRVFLGALAIALLSSCATQGPTAANAKEEVAAATAAWVAAFNSREPGRITALYDADAILWGTSAKKIATTPVAVAEYFQDMPKTPNLRVVVGEQHIRIFGSLAINTGYYTFTFPKGEVASRFTFVFRHRDGKWMIVDHHSSRIP